MTDQPSLFTLSAQTHRDFDRVLATIPPGRLITSNELRDLMDAADIPLTARGPLLGAACRRGVIEAASVVIDGVPYGLTRASTGESAKGAGVKVYVRRAA